MPPPSGSTPTLLLPYPVPNDPVDVPRDIKALADKLDSSLGGGGSGGGGILKAAPVLDVGVTGQVRAGRQLALADFTDLGLSAPAGLWNLSNLTDASGNGRTLSNRNAVTFAGGINGTAATAAQFRGASGTPANDPALYIADDATGTLPGAQFRIKTGSVGCWFRTAKRGVNQMLVSKFNNVAASNAYYAQIVGSNQMGFTVVLDAAGTTANAPCVSDVCDDRWHFMVGTHDGTTVRLFVDGVLEGTGTGAGSINPGSAPLNIGAWGADAGSAAAAPNFGRVDEAFVTADVLSEDQIRVLYAARIAHTLGTTPRSATLSVNRRRKGAAFAVADFTTQPLRLYNFTGAALTTDEGSNGVPLTFVVGWDNTAGADGSARGASEHHGGWHLAATDAGLPAALTARSYGCWFKTTVTLGVILGWSNAITGAALGINGNIFSTSGADTLGGTYVSDGQWHFAVEVQDNAAGDGVRRKLYLDGRLVGGSTVMNSITLGGANRFRIGAYPDGTAPFTGQIDGVFVTGYPLTAADIATLYAKSSQGLGASPKEAGAHVERMDATAVYLIADTLETQHTIDLGVAS